MYFDLPLETGHQGEGGPEAAKYDGILAAAYAGWRLVEQVLRAVRRPSDGQ
jgi:hypothetical protein